MNFLSSKDYDEKPVIHLKNHNIEIMTNDKANEIIDELSQSLSTSY